ncbi:MAG: protein BatD [Gilvibacter sp.]|nr:BatD family protein [Gilvibacter sp.]NQX77491.1 protein BatD [Gilvibacter sp.]
MEKMRSILFVLIALCGFQGWAQVQFNASASKEKLGINERVRIDFQMNKDGDNFTPPDFDGFRVVGGPNQSVNNIYANGKKTYSKTFSYFLSPMSRGKFTIKQATVEIDGELYKTLPITIEVTAAVDVPKDGNNAEYVASENVHLVAEVSKRNPYLNEAIAVTYKLYVSEDVSVTRAWREIDIPKYADFWSQVKENRQRRVFEGKFKGRNYRYVILKTAVLYPQKTGELNIEPLVLDVPVEVLSNKRDFFGRRLTTTVNQTVAAGNLTIDVKPLPEEGKPANFTGAVGDFKFNISASRNQVDANESLEIRVQAEGDGNLKLFNLPELTLPSTLEVYDPKREENIKTNSSGMSGSIATVYTVVPQFKGTYPVQPLRFSYFDLTTETYKTITSDGTVITVENGPVSSDSTADDNTATAGGGTKNIIQTGDQFNYIKLKSSLQPIASPTFFKSALYWSLMGGPLLLIPIFIIAGKKRKERLADAEGQRKRKADRLVKKYLSEAKKNLGDSALFYESLERAMHNYLRAKLRIETTEMAKEKIAQMLEDKGAQTDSITQFIELLKSCEFARYASGASNNVAADYEKATLVITQLDKQL